MEAGVPQPGVEEMSGVSAKMSVLEEDTAAARAKTWSAARGETRERQFRRISGFSVPFPSMNLTDRSSLAAAPNFPLPHRDH